MQIIAENLNKRIINIVEIRNGLLNSSISNTLYRVPGLQINYLQVCRDNVMQDRNNLADVDCLIVNNLSNDEIVSIFNKLIQAERKKLRSLHLFSISVLI